jgi:hypothetical protein
LERLRTLAPPITWVKEKGHFVSFRDENAFTLHTDEKKTRRPLSSSRSEHAARPHRNCTSDTAIIDKLLNGTGYNRFRIPQETGVDVAVEFWLQAITSISEITNDFEMDIYINEMWMDPALNFEHLSPCKQNLSLSHQVGGEIREGEIWAS